ncbi:CBASS cGAMP synthase (plasmid) [Macrococcus psychrotolerans]|uniref:Cyclic GMP-AMP synthase n=1 Tax=Macrococcus psychrotolerans TaxID=3039389 RepID=A0AAT9P777_9STAP|nr:MULTISPECIES: hypothetical protein [Macrococcus]QYA34105.1 hypothetical protein KYI10_11960 [Macrococcus sp. 19Msa1099]QYA38889.1 hypothetical protein KYI07_11840 [Macrococcus caseolyticus]QYA77612.1 hypothetical protein KYI12_11930 [Macrococcus caseolyticus]
MSYLQNIFLEFNENITISESYKHKIRRGRNTLREKINGGFLNDGHKKPEHLTQGSYAMHTALLPEDGEDFDLDSGIYLKDYDTEQIYWPSTIEVHKQILSYVSGHTNCIIDKDTCVRVDYQDNYHIDLPIYIIGLDKQNDEVAYLAHKINGWIISDPKAFRDWFNNNVKISDDKVVRRIVKYIKKWSKNKNINLPGMAISILVVECYEKADNDPDVLFKVLTNIYDRLEDNFSCRKPIRPLEEDLLEKYSFQDEQEILKELKEFKDLLHESIYISENEKMSTDILSEIFGSKFPIGDSDVKNINILTQTDVPEKIGLKNRHYA